MLKKNSKEVKTAANIKGVILKTWFTLIVFVKISSKFFLFKVNFSKNTL